MSKAVKIYVENIKLACRYIPEANPFLSEVVSPDEAEQAILGQSETDSKMTGVTKLVRSLAVKATYDEIKDKVPAMKNHEIATMMRVPNGILNNSVATKEMERIKEDYQIEIGGFFDWIQNEKDKASD